MTSNEKELGDATTCLEEELKKSTIVNNESVEESLKRAEGYKEQGNEAFKS